MFARDIDSALDYERISSPNLAALHRTRSSDSLIAASDISELSTWSETSSYAVVDPLSSEGSSEVDFEWAVSEECTRQLGEAMSAPVHYAGESRSDGPEQNAAAFSAKRNPFGCRGLHPGIPYITPPVDGYLDHDTEATCREDSCLSSPYHSDITDEVEAGDAADSIIDAAEEVFAHDPCHQEPKGFKLPFFSKKKPSSAPKSTNKPVSRLGFGIRMPSVPSMGKLFGKHLDSTGALRGSPIREAKTQRVCQPCLGREETREVFFFDQQVEQKEQFVRLSNASTATLSLVSVEEMQTLNDALPISKL